jgi:hypothetical protein
MMDVAERLRSIRCRLELSRRELQLQPECFQATVELAIAAGEISEILGDAEQNFQTEDRWHSKISA